MKNRVLLISAISVVLMLNSKKAKKLTRGLRNKNPGNIRHNPANQWVGQVGADSEGFVKFRSFRYGVRAISRVLDSYRQRGIRTVRDIISTYAPPFENDTESYINTVSKQTKLLPDQVVKNSDYIALIGAIIKHENGINPFAKSQIERWTNS